MITKGQKTRQKMKDRTQKMKDKTQKTEDKRYNTNSQSKEISSLSYLLKKDVKIKIIFPK